VSVCVSVVCVCVMCVWGIVWYLYVCVLQLDGRRGEIMFAVQPYTHQRYSEGSNKALGTPGYRD